MKRLFALLLIASCTIAPITGRRQLDLVGDATMNQLGLQSYEQALAKAKTDHDQAHVAMVARVTKRIAEAAEQEFHPGYDWQATVIDEPKTVNAWCMPGGKMAVYSGIFPIAQDENGLAVVMAHEISHALAHHSAERLSRSEIMQLGESGLLAAVNAKEPGATKIIGGALGLGAQLGIDMPFSRQQESEADHIGLVLMAKAGYDPARAVDFWGRMLRYSKGREPPAFLSDHPSSEQRVEDIKRELPEAQAAYVAHR